MEFKVVRRRNIRNVAANAVAPDWNLKLTGKHKKVSVTMNAVAPDWNLKIFPIVQNVLSGKMQSHQIGI